MHKHTEQSDTYVGSKTMPLKQYEDGEQDGALMCHLRVSHMLFTTQLQSVICNSMCNIMSCFRSEKFCNFKIVI